MQKIQTTDKQFHDGDGITTMDTVVTAKFLNDIRNDLCHVIESAGIDLDVADNSQHELSFGDLAKLAYAIAERNQKIVLQARAKKDAVEKAKAPEAVASIERL